MTLPTYPEALATILNAVVPRGTETIGVRQSLGRVLARDVGITRDFPDLPRSAVDGFAFQAGWEGPFEVVMEIPAGHMPEGSLRKGQAAAIMTGAVVPEGADMVAMVEVCRLDGTTLIVDAPQKAGEMINPQGHEAFAGASLAKKGCRLGASLYSALFCGGVTEVQAFHQPRVGILATGDELCEVENGPQPGKVFNTNQYIVEAICTELGLPFESMPAVEDTPETVARAIDELSTRCDFIVTSGGVSVGRYDFVRTTLEKEPFELFVQGTKIKPGRPLHVARKREALVFAMPGYPSAVLTNALLYLVPALKKASGRNDFESGWIWGVTRSVFRGRPGSQYMARVKTAIVDGRFEISDPGSQMSSHFLNFAQVGGIARLPVDPDPQWIQEDGSYRLPEGSRVEFLDLDRELI